PGIGFCPQISVTSGGDIDFDFVSGTSVDMILTRDALSVLSQPGNPVTLSDNVLNSGNNASGAFTIATYLWGGSPPFPSGAKLLALASRGRVGVTNVPSINACTPTTITETIPVPATLSCK